VACVAVLAPAITWAASFRVDPERTRLAVRLYKEGVGGRLAHDHVVEAAEVSGQVEYDAARPEASSVMVEARTASLRVDEPAARRQLGLEGDLSESQRADVGKTMRSPEQLDVARYPTIRFASTRVVADAEGRLRVTGQLTLRGVTREVTFPATVELRVPPVQRRPRRDPEQGRGHAPHRPGRPAVSRQRPEARGAERRGVGMPRSGDEWRTFGHGYLPGLIGIEIGEVARGHVTSRLAVRQELLAPNGYLHAATVVALADTSCGYGTVASLPDGARGFTTVELKSNFLGTVLEGTIACEATLVHGGRTTQVWDARVTDEATARVIALFRCTQLLLYPR
jgi:1,4-dihydroxy-2-naphthoyl-CoA hydrolase